MKLDEKLLLKNWNEYVKLVADAYDRAPSFDASVKHHWMALNSSNHLLFKRLLSKIKLIFTTETGEPGKINIDGKEYPLVKMKDPYATQQQMAQDVKKTGTLKISIDYSKHPIFSVEDNIVFRTVHDYIVHILGNHPFGAKGEIASYNLHAKLVPKDAIPAIFTEVVGQGSVAVVTGSFPEQKIAVLQGFDFINLGKVDDYAVQNKELIKKEHRLKKLKLILEFLEKSIQ